MLRLNLASGTDIKDGWVNLDIVPKWPAAKRGCDMIWDARKDAIPFGDNSVDEIYAGYLLLHLAPYYHKPVLAEIRRVLAPTGILTVGEVDMEIVLERYLDDPSDKRYSELIWGEQAAEFAEFDKHCQGFTEQTLRELLCDNGFKDFKRINIHCAGVFYELTIQCRKVV